MPDPQPQSPAVPPWEQLHLLLYTTNGVRDPLARRSLAATRSVKALRGSYLDRDDGPRRWGTRWARICEIVPLIPPECRVGDFGMTLAEVAREVCETLGPLASESEAKLARWDDLIGIDLRHHSGLPDAMREFALSPRIIAASAKDAQYGPFTVALNMRLAADQI